ncbi:MAG: hypothetical protein HY221_02295 [Candidatus Sungbacteria bacterium]|uniref:Uncharacterized protein n=1 Tax=Candidatus Sungiibacteriota bacterium TaxID=2750080 RepID=A0A932R0C9_9BACT|nr:hypothetical protein [Candidatus Sungbacteria bacterium]
MTELLERAVKKVNTLTDSEQNAIAALILEEIADEVRWDRTFANTQDALAKMAADAMAEDHAGKTNVLDPDKL